MVKFTVMLTDDEHKKLKLKASKTGLKMGPFIRKLIMEEEIRARPPNEYVQLVREINYIGNNINQIAMKINSGAVSSYNFTEVINMQRKIYEQMLELVGKN